MRSRPTEPVERTACVYLTAEQAAAVREYAEQHAVAWQAAIRHFVQIGIEVEDGNSRRTDMDGAILAARGRA